MESDSDGELERDLLAGGYDSSDDEYDTWLSNQLAGKTEALAAPREAEQGNAWAEFQASAAAMATSADNTLEELQAVESAADHAVAAAAQALSEHASREPSNDAAVEAGDISVTAPAASSIQGQSDSPGLAAGYGESFATLEVSARKEVAETVQFLVTTVAATALAIASGVRRTIKPSLDKEGVALDSKAKTDVAVPKEALLEEALARDQEAANAAAAAAAVARAKQQAELEAAAQERARVAAAAAQARREAAATAEAAMRQEIAKAEAEDEARRQLREQQRAAAIVARAAHVARTEAAVVVQAGMRGTLGRRNAKAQKAMWWSRVSAAVLLQAMVRRQQASRLVAAREAERAAAAQRAADEEAARLAAEAQAAEEARQAAEAAAAAAAEAQARAEEEEEAMARAVAEAAAEQARQEAAAEAAAAQAATEARRQWREAEPLRDAARAAAEVERVALAAEARAKKLATFGYPKSYGLRGSINTRDYSSSPGNDQATKGGCSAHTTSASSSNVNSNDSSSSSSEDDESNGEEEGGTKVRVLNGPAAALALFGPDTEAAAPAIARRKRRQERSSRAAADAADAAAAAEANAKAAAQREAAAAAAAAESEDPRARLRREMEEADARRASLLAATIAPSQAHHHRNGAGNGMGLAANSRSSGEIIDAATSAILARAKKASVRPYQGPSRVARATAMAKEVEAHLALLSRNPSPLPPHFRARALQAEAAEVQKGGAVSPACKRSEASWSPDEVKVAEAVRALGLGSDTKSGDKSVVSVELDVENLRCGLSVVAYFYPRLCSLSLNVNQVQDLEASGLLTLLASLHSTLQALSLRDNGLRNLRGLGAVAATAESLAAAAGGPTSGDDDRSSSSTKPGAGLSTLVASTTLSLRELSVDVNKLTRLEAHEVNPWGASLQRLSVSSNQLVDWPSTSSLGGALNLPHLQRLDAHHNMLSSLPASALVGLPRLVHLDLGRNSLGPTVNGHTLSAAKCLETLVLSQNRLEALPAPLQLPLLRKLWLGSNRLSDMSAWADDKSSSGDETTSKYNSRSSSTDKSNNDSGCDTVESAANATAMSAKQATWLPSLECLHLDSNQLVCLPPGCFVGLPLLRHLDLSFNALPGEGRHHQTYMRAHSQSLEQSPQQLEHAEQQVESTALPHVAYACLSGLLRPAGSAARLVSLSLKDNPLTAHEPRYAPPTAPSPPTIFTPAAAAAATTLEPAGEAAADQGGVNQQPAAGEVAIATTGAAALAAPLATPAPPDWERPLVTWLAARLPSLRSLDGMPLGPARRALARATATPDAADVAAINAQPLSMALSGDQGIGAAECGVARASALFVVPWLRALARNFRNRCVSPSKTEISLGDNTANSSKHASALPSSPGKHSRRTSRQHRKGHKAASHDTDTAEEEELAMMLAEEESSSPRKKHAGSGERTDRKGSKPQRSRSRVNELGAGASRGRIGKKNAGHEQNAVDDRRQFLLEALWRSRRWACSECGGQLRPTPPTPPMTTTTTTTMTPPPDASNRSVSTEDGSGNLSEGGNRVISSAAAPAMHEQPACAQCGTKHVLPPAPPLLSWRSVAPVLTKSTTAGAHPNLKPTKDDVGYAALEGAVASARQLTEALRKRHRAEEDADAPETNELFLSQGSSTTAGATTAAAAGAASALHELSTKVDQSSSTQTAAARKLVRRARHAMEVAARLDAALQAQLSDAVLSASDSGSDRGQEREPLAAAAAAAASFGGSHWPMGRFQKAPASQAAAEAAAAQAKAERLAEEVARVAAEAAGLRANVQKAAATTLQQRWRGALQRLRWHRVSRSSDSGSNSIEVYSKENLVLRRAKRQAQQHAGASLLQAWARGRRCRRKVAAAKRNCLAYDDPEVEGLLFGEGEGALLSDLKRFLDALGDSSSAAGPQSPLLQEGQERAKPTRSPNHNNRGNHEVAAVGQSSTGGAQVAGKRRGRSDLEVVAATEAAANNAAFHRTKLECLYAKVNPAKLAEVGTFVTKYAGFYDGMWAKLGEKYGKSAVHAAHEEAMSLNNSHGQDGNNEVTVQASSSESGTKHERTTNNNAGATKEEVRRSALPALAWVDGASAARNGARSQEDDINGPSVAALRASAALHDDARPVRSPVVVARVRAHQRRAADLYQDEEVEGDEGPGHEEEARGRKNSYRRSTGGALDNEGNVSRRPPSGAFVVDVAHQQDEFEAYDQLGPSVSRPTTSSAASELSVASGHWPSHASGALGVGPGAFSASRAPPLYPLPRATASSSKEAPLRPPSPSEPLLRSTPRSARSLPPLVATPNQNAATPSATSSSSAKRSSRRGGAEGSAEKEAAAAQAWGLADPAVARAAVAREEALNRGQRDAAQRAKESDPAYRYKKLMKAVAHNTAAAAASAGNGTGGGNGGGGEGAIERQRRKRAAAAAAAEANTGSGAAWGAAGTSVFRDRARHQQRANAKKRLPAWATMPPIDPK